MLTTPLDLYTKVKDSIRTINKQAASKAEIKKCQSMIKKFLTKMDVDFEIQKLVLENVQNAKTLEELIRSRKILKVLQHHGLKGDAADQFFLGGHF